jgi:hypothetical protein
MVEDKRKLLNTINHSNVETVMSFIKYLKESDSLDLKVIYKKVKDNPKFLDALKNEIGWTSNGFNKQIFYMTIFGLKRHEYEIRSDGTVDVRGNVDMTECDFNKIPLQFGIVDGYFECSGNRLTTLEGCPEKVTSGFYCNNNKLTSLKYSPKEVGGVYECESNLLTSLDGVPDEVDAFHCGFNFNGNLKSLKGGPSKVYNTYSCVNSGLVSLEGCPEEVDGNFDCNGNELKTLKGGPSKVTGRYHCSDNQLITLEGCPEKIGNGFDCSRNKLKTLEGAPKEVRTYFFCNGNDVKFTEEQVRAVCKVGGKIYG